MTAEKQLTEIKETLETVLGFVEKNHIPSDQAINMDEATKISNMPKSTLYKLVMRGEVPHFKRGRSTYFHRSDFVAWLYDKKKFRPSKK